MIFLWQLYRSLHSSAHSHGKQILAKSKKKNIRNPGFLIQWAEKINFENVQLIPLQTLTSNIILKLINLIILLEVNSTNINRVGKL